MIELPILGLLKDAPLHGYELKRRLQTLVGYFGSASYGSLYPMLRKLEERGHVTRTVEEQRGPERIVYRITQQGEARLLELMHDPNVPFTLKMLFFQSIPPSDRRQLLEEQRDEWARKLGQRRQDRERIGGRPGDRYRSALLARAMDQLDRDLAWIEGLIAQESADEEPGEFAEAGRHRVRNGVLRP